MIQDHLPSDGSFSDDFSLRDEAHVSGQFTLPDGSTVTTSVRLAVVAKVRRRRVDADELVREWAGERFLIDSALTADQYLRMQSIKRQLGFLDRRDAPVFYFSLMEHTFVSRVAGGVMVDHVHECSPVTGQTFTSEEAAARAASSLILTIDTDFLTADTGLDEWLQASA